MPTESTGTSWTFVIEKKLVSANRYLVNHGASRWAYKKERDGWYIHLVHARLQNEIPKARGKRHVSFVRLFSGRERLLDPDNLAAATKALLDAMVLDELLEDDSAAFVAVDWSQERAETSGVRITITEAA